MYAERLKPGECIGIISPCHVGDPANYERINAVRLVSKKGLLILMPWWLMMLCK